MGRSAALFVLAAIACAGLTVWLYRSAAQVRRGRSGIEGPTMDEAAARMVAAAAAIRAVQETVCALEPQGFGQQQLSLAVEQAVAPYWRRLSGSAGPVDDIQAAERDAIGRVLLKAAVQAELDCIAHLLSTGAVKPEIAQKLLKELDQSLGGGALS